MTTYGWTPPPATAVCAKCGVKVEVPATLPAAEVRCGFACLPAPVFDHPSTEHLLPRWKRGMR
jgi:hypothetical protein